MRKTICVVLCAMVFPSFPLFAGKKSTAETLVGAWRVESYTQNGKKAAVGPDSVWIEFLADGTGKALRLGVKGDREIKNLRWVLRGNVLSITEEGKTGAENPAVVSFAAGGDRLSLTVKDNNLVMSASRDPKGLPDQLRESSEANPDAVFDNSLARRLAGIWRVDEAGGGKSDSVIWYELRSDGSCRMIQGAGGKARIMRTGHWSMNGPFITLSDEGQSEGERAEAVLSDDDALLELIPDSSDRKLRLMRETDALPPIGE